MNPQKISLAIITGNIGAPMMNRFLDHFWQVADEIIVVRAIGNEPPDASLEIAFDRGCVTAEYHNRIKTIVAESGHHHICGDSPSNWPHVDDFAAARNQAWDLATGDWIMWADTDDIITPEAAAAIRAAIEEKGDRFDMLQTPYCVPDAGLLDNPRERVVRRGIARWAQPVHECLEPIDPDAKWRTATCAEGRIVHDPGPRPPAARNGRNLRILESLPPDKLTTSLRYHLFAELFAMGRKAEGALAAEQFLLLKDAGPVERFECALSLSMVAEDPADKAQWLQLAWHECPHRREPLVLLSNLALNADDPARAEAYLRAAERLPLPQPAPWNLRRKMWGWQFVQEQARVLRTQGNFPKAEALETNHFRRHGARISLLHATRGRAQQAIETRALWLERAADPDAIEHIFGLDPDDTEGPALGGFRHIIQDSHDGGPCGAWNIAATVAAGEVFVQVSDDMIPPQGWDRAILDALGVTTVPAVLRVSDGHRTDGLIVLAIVTRAWWRQEGHLFHPAFFSMYSDNWLTERAAAHGAIIEAPHLLFEHRHPVFTGEPWHPTTAASNAPERYAEGRRILDELRSATPSRSRRPRVVLMAHQEVIGFTLAHNAPGWRTLSGGNLAVDLPREGEDAHAGAAVQGRFLRILRAELERSEWDTLIIAEWDTFTSATTPPVPPLRSILSVKWVWVGQKSPLALLSPWVFDRPAVRALLAVAADVPTGEGDDALLDRWLARVATAARVPTPLLPSAHAHPPEDIPAARAAGYEYLHPVKTPLP
jgi:hypothetical protein